jgi:hypothetical protein
MEGRPESVPYWEAYDGARSDLVTEFSDAIERRARELRRLEPGTKASDAIRQAETEILRAVLSGDGLSIM